MLQRAASNAYSWWWASHIRTKQSKWLDNNLQEMDGRVKTMLRIIDEDADSFAKRAEMYFKRRPELTSFVEEAYRAYRALAERYDHISGELHKANHTIATAFPEQVQYAMLEEEDENFPKAITPIDPRKIHKPTVDGLVSKRREESQPPLKKSQQRIGIPFNRDNAQEEINKLQKVILVLQTEKEFIKSSYESGMAKYWEIEKKIIEMQEDVYYLKDEFNASAVIEDDEARALMTATALKSCEDAICRLHEQKNKSKEKEMIEFNRIKASREKLQALNKELVKFQIDITAISNQNAERNCSIANNEEICSFNKDRIELQSLCEKVKAYLEQNPDTTVEEIAESIDVLVNRTIILELTVTKQSAQFDRLSSEINELEKYLQSLEEEKMILINDSKELRNKLHQAKEQLIIVENLEENIQYEEINLRKDLYETYISFTDVSEKLQAPSDDGNAHITSDSMEDEIPSCNEVTEWQNTEVTKIHGVKEDSVEEIHVAQELGHLVKEHPQVDAGLSKDSIDMTHVAQELGQSITDHSQLDADLERDYIDKIHLAQELGQSVTDHSQLDADLETDSIDKIHVNQELGQSVTYHSQLDAELEKDSTDKIYVAQELGLSVTDHSQLDVDFENDSIGNIHVAQELDQSVTNHSQLDADLEKDSIDKIHVAQELGESVSDHSQFDAGFKINSNSTSEKLNIFMQEDSSHPHVSIRANTINNQETQLEKKEKSTNLHQLLLSTLEGREKILLAEYTSILRNYKETKKKLLEVEQKNENHQNEMMALIRELKDANSTKDEEILLLKQQLASSKQSQEDHVGFPAEAKEHCNGHQKPERRSSLSTLVVEDLKPQCSQVTEDTNISSTIENDTTNAVTETESLLPEDIYLQHIDELNSTSATEEKFRSEMDKLLEENLEFWLRFNASYHHIQELQTKFEELQTDMKKMNNTVTKEGSSGPLRDQIPEPNSASIVTQLRALKTELQVWLEQSKFLQDELQIRLSSLCSIQEEITGTAKESLLSEDFQLTPYQAAKFQGEVLNMKQENNKVAKELQVGIDHVRRLQVGVDRALAKLHVHLVLSGLGNSHTDPLKSSPVGARIPLRSFLFGAKPKKQSLFACVNPALQRHYSDVRQGLR